MARILGPSQRVQFESIMQIIEIVSFQIWNSLGVITVKVPARYFFILPTAKFIFNVTILYCLQTHINGGRVALWRDMQNIFS